MYDMLLIDETKKITLQDVVDYKLQWWNLTKAVVDIEQQKMVIWGELHVDEEQILLEQWSQQSNLWWINLYPDKFETDDFIEFDSMINLRPRDNNRSRGVDDEAIQKKIKNIVSLLLIRG